MPKYIINAGSDEFFSTDSWRFYYDKLPGEKIIRYVPNKNHSLDGRYLTEDLVSYFYRVINDIEIPSLSWNLSDNKLIAELDYDGDYDVSVWTAKMIMEETLGFGKKENFGKKHLLVSWLTINMS
ncbi:MAG: hypothetical protein CM15mP102_18520 [Flavobacteriales bacterium]|nr:MAG: hypothetical protein CM15mP102_18520 [Flavobacteriales bacterium]